MTKNHSVGLIGNNSLENNNVSVFHCFVFTSSVSLKVLMIIAYSIVMATSIVGNTLLAIVYFKNKSMKSTVNCCIMNMAFVDLLLALLYMPRMLARIVVGLEWLVDGTSDLILCKIASLSQEISICVSILTMVIIAFERFFAVLLPLRLMISKRLSTALLSCTWLVSLAARSPIFYAVKTIHFPSGELGCVWLHYLSFPTEEARTFYHVFMLIAFYGLPLVCIITLYTAILISLKRREALIGNATRNRALATNKKVTRMILAVITAFLLGWLLYFIVMPLEEFWNVFIPCEVHFLRIFLGHVNCACNPVICFIFSENYRKEIKQGKCLGRLRWKRPRRHDLRESALRDRSTSNTAILRVRELEPDSSFHPRRSSSNTSYKYGESGV